MVDAHQGTIGEAVLRHSGGAAAVVATRSPARQRDRSIDFLRFLGALVVMIAHAEPPAWLFQLRNFGTPMLIIVSALATVVVFRERPLLAWPYLQKRVLRVTVPPWLFLTAFFAVVLAYSGVLGKPFPFSSNDVWMSYALTSGIGYVWVFKVYLITALLTPLMMKLKASVPSKSAYFLILAAAYLLYELLNVVLQASIHDAGTLTLVNDTLIVVLPYAVLFAYGLQIDELGDQTIFWISIASLLIFVAMAVAKFRLAGQFVPTQKFKYPPTLYYLSYAIFCVNSLYLVSKSALIARLPSRPIEWLSSNLLWIYLWHILGIFVWDRLLGSTHEQLGPSALKLVFLLAVGVSLTWLQKRAVERLLPPGPGRVRQFARELLG